LWVISRWYSNGNFPCHTQKLLVKHLSPGCILVVYDFLLDIVGLLIVITIISLLIIPPKIISMFINDWSF
jgi:hypothetical protein